MTAGDKRPRPSGENGTCAKKNGEDMSSYTEGQVHQLANALEGADFTPDDVTKLGQNEGLGDIRGVLRGTHEIRQVARPWHEENDVIYFRVKSDGTTGEQWISRLKGNGFRVQPCAVQVLRSPDFKPTSGVTTEVAVLRGCLFKDNDRITKKIRAAGVLRNLLTPDVELACLIREKFTDEEIIKGMDLWYIITMHEPINNSDGGSHLLDVNHDGVGRWLGACSGRPGRGWGRVSGFAFAVSQVSSES